MSSYSLPLTILASLGATLPAVIVFFIKRSIRESYKETQRLSTRLSDHCTDAFQGIRDLRLLGDEDWFVRRLERDYLALHQERARHHVKLEIIGNGTNLLSTLLSISILLVGAYAVHAERLSQGQLMFAFSMAGSMLGPLEGLVISWLFFEDAAGALDRYEQVMTLPAVRPAGSSKVREVKGDLRLERVTFGYKAGQPVLHDITLQIPAGRSIAIVGESGAGKTTLLNLLTGHYIPQEGRVLLDGSDLRTWDHTSWRSRLGVVLQDPYLFRITLEENFRLGCAGATAEDVKRALGEASAEEFISRLPDGMKTEVQAGGAPFSGGQAQRLALARALVRNPKVLLLDEATSNLDLATESAVWTALEGGRGRRTTVFVTHRLSSSARADEIVVLDAGRIVEQGSFRDLLERNGRFADLWRRQQAVNNVEGRPTCSMPLADGLLMGATKL
jgi:ABC-type bacteriocin/lantibiotic exporter with double-glycine peptidase domain